MRLSQCIFVFIVSAFASLFLGILTAAGLIPVFLFDITPRGYLSFTYTALMFAITLMLWELRGRIK
jgi:hypothetical protein